jgi:hypothetical protein
LFLFESSVLNSDPFPCRPWRSNEAPAQTSFRIDGAAYHQLNWPGRQNLARLRHADCAIGFYLGIDTPPLAFRRPNGEPSNGGSVGTIDAAEFLSAVGTFLSALTAFVSVGVIVLRENPRIIWTIIIMLGRVVGLMMQIVAGAIARTRT